MYELLKKLLPADKGDPESYEWMVKETPQHEWIDDQGMLLWLAFFCSEIGAGTYFISLFHDFTPGYVVGYVLALVLGGLIHMAYLGNPQRAFRMFLKVRTSELSRGMWVMALFAILGFFQILPWFHFGILMKTLMGIICLLVIMHGFATMNVMKALPSWNQSTVLPLSILSGIWVGSQILELMMGMSGMGLEAIEVWCRVILIAYMVLMALYVWGTYHASTAARFSMSELLTGHFSQVFFIGVLAIGFAVPLLITLTMWAAGVHTGAVFLRLLFVIAGDLILRYSIMKSAFYTPLL